MNIKYFFKFQTKRLILISHLFFISCDKHEQIKEENNENIKEQITIEKYDCGSNSSGISRIMLNKNIKNENINIIIKNREEASKVTHSKENQISFLIEGMKVQLNRDIGEVIVKNNNLFTIIQCKKLLVLKKN